ncbi:MAG: oxidoreductase [Patescibacteria group bacterium]
MKSIDRFLNSITMYRLVQYGLYVMVAYAIICGFFGVLPYGGFSLLGSFVILGLIAALANTVFSKIFRAPTNHESASITSLILFFILIPVISLQSVYILVAAAVVAMASKYVFAIRKKHIFNPAAISAAIVGFAGSGAAVWWVGTIWMVPVVLIFGLLIVRKLRRFTLFWSFILTAVAVSIYIFSSEGFGLGEILKLVITSWPLLFFATVMLTEPLTTPPSRKLQIMYGVIVGILFSSQFNIGPIYTSPELALIIGNIFSFIVSSHQKLTLRLKSKTQLSGLIYSFTFTADQKLRFKSGQYLEWTMPGLKVDERGNRRFFTIASSPTEPDIHLGVRVQQDGSSFKDHLLEMKEGDMMMAGSLSGEFTLPKDSNEKLVFIAGGIGVTPFRSMVKYLLDKKEKRDITLFYACASENDFVYMDVFAEAEREIGLKVVYIVTDVAKVTEAWKGKTGYITAELITDEVVDPKNHLFYLSGPDAMVRNYKKLILKMEISRTHIRTDYFPGF